MAVTVWVVSRSSLDESPVGGARVELSSTASSVWPASVPAGLSRASCECALPTNIYTRLASTRKKYVVLHPSDDVRGEKHRCSTTTQNPRKIRCFRLVSRNELSRNEPSRNE